MFISVLVSRVAWGQVTQSVVTGADVSKQDPLGPSQDRPLPSILCFRPSLKATHSSILAWKIPWTEEPGWLQTMGLQRVRHD